MKAGSSSLPAFFVRQFFDDERGRMLQTRRCGLPTFGSMKMLFYSNLRIALPNWRSTLIVNQFSDELFVAFYHLSKINPGSQILRLNPYLDLLLNKHYQMCFTLYVNDLPIKGSDFVPLEEFGFAPSGRYTKI